MIDEFEPLLLQTFPPEDRVEEDDPAYPEFEADSGCRVCASGQPCRERIANDIHDILVEAGLPDTDRLACLQWMIREGCSTLTQSITHMAEAFAQAQQQQADAALIAAQNKNMREFNGLAKPQTHPICGDCTELVEPENLTEAAAMLAQAKQNPGKSV